MASSEDVLFPHGGWDTHHHIFEPTVGDFERFLKSQGLTKSVLTQGLSYGTDNVSLKTFKARLGDITPSAICVIDPEETTAEKLRDLHANGIRGLRVNLYRYSAMEDVELQKKALLAHLNRVTSLSLPWNLTMTTIRTESWDILEPFVREHVVKAGVPLITDHFALIKAPSMLPEKYRKDPTQQPGFAAIMRLVRDGHLYVKMSAPYRISEQSPHYEDLKFLVRAFIESNKQRVLWGSDWPHTPRMKVRTREAALKEEPFLQVDTREWLRTLRGWLSDDEWNLLMVENPAKLFGQ